MPSGTTGNGLPGLYLAHFLETLLPDPARRKALLDAAGLDDDLGARPDVALATVLDLIERIDRQARPGWHIAPALAMEATHHGPLGVAVVTAATVQDALATLTSLEAVRAAFVHIQPEPDAAGWQARLLARAEPTGPWRLLMEINLLALAGLIRRLLAPASRDLQLTLPGGYRAWQQHLHQALPDQVHPTGADYRLALPRAVLARPCRLADPRLHADAVERCKSILAERRGGGALEADIRRRLLALPGRPPGLATMARQLGLSRRTLHRRLQADGLSYRDLVGQVQATVAADRLRHTRLPIARIAEELGYQDTANFGRACRRWFGCPPGELRTRAQLP